MLSENKETAILTIDVEDNFTMGELVRSSDWEKYEKQVVENTTLAISLLRELNAGATFFVLGKVAERHPELVMAINDAGHEVASHGHAHEPVWSMTRGRFEDDVNKSIACLGAITKTEIRGFRARSFSITKRTLWALEVLENNGLVYDASMKDVELVGDDCGRRLIEFPISTVSPMGRNVALSGGVMLRLAPFSWYLRMLRGSSSFRLHRVLYCHVWEFNKDQPKRNVGLLQSIFQSPGTFTTARKIRSLSEYFSFVSIRTYLESNRF